MGQVGTQGTAPLFSLLGRFSKELLSFLGSVTHMYITAATNKARLPNPTCLLPYYQWGRRASLCIFRAASSSSCCQLHSSLLLSPPRCRDLPVQSQISFFVNAKA